MWSNPVRASLRDGVRVCQRYPALALALGFFGFGYALFQLGLRYYFFTTLPAAEPASFLWSRGPYRPSWEWVAGARDALWVLPANAVGDAAREAVIPMLDGTAGLFNNLVSTFPLAALAALLLLVNWRGRQGVLWRALRRRCGGWGHAVHAAILLCALAAVIKPGLYVLPRFVDAQLWLEWSPVVAWLAFLFEYLFGVCVQLYLLLLAYCWVRGLTFRPGHLHEFAIRRFSFVLRWAAVVMLLSTLFIDLPLMLQNAPFFSRWFTADVAALDARTNLARVVLDVVFLTCASVQITLMLHNESLRKSLRDHLRFAWRNAWPLAWFILIAALHFYGVHFAHLLGQRGFGEGTALWVAWELVFPWLAGAVGAWLLASWVSMFKRTDVGRLGDQEWVRF